MGFFLKSKRLVEWFHALALFYAMKFGVALADATYLLRSLAAGISALAFLDVLSRAWRRKIVGKQLSPVGGLLPHLAYNSCDEQRWSYREKLGCIARTDDIRSTSLPVWSRTQRFLSL